MPTDWKPFELDLFDEVIRIIAEAYGEQPNRQASLRRSTFHAQMAHALLDNAVGGDRDKAVSLMGELYDEEAIPRRVLPRK